MLKAMTSAKILDPKAAPVIGVDAHLPAIAAQRLTPDFLRQRFAAPPVWQPEMRGDGALISGRAPAHASVLLPLVMREQGLQVLLTRRTEHLRAHAGQISFPGGRAEPEDGSAQETALREASEEIGLERRHVEVLGELPLYTTVTAFEVTPVVALLDASFELTLDSYEVAEAFEVPLAFLMDPAHHRQHRFVFDAGRERQFLSMPWMEPGVAGEPRERFIWGATAAMLRNFYRFLAA